LALGCWALAGGAGWGDQDEQQAIATIHAALDHGINFFDTAEGYGNGVSEEIVGKALVDRRDKALIATKISPNHAHPDQARDYLEASLRRLQTDYVDLYIIHWPLQSLPVADTLSVLEACKKEGKIRAIGVSNFGKANLDEMLAADVEVAANQCCYNLLSRAIEFDVLPICRDNQISITAYMPLLQGILAGKWQTIDDIPAFRTRTRHFSSTRPGTRHGSPGAEAQVAAALDAIRTIAADLNWPMANVALAWVAAQEGLASVLAGGRKPEQIERNVKAMAQKLPPDVIVRLNQVTDALKNELGPNIDYWQGTDNARSR
jgi:aryl-alcohol dehydrogenase-like predicted oxidoreductase